MGMIFPNYEPQVPCSRHSTLAKVRHGLQGFEQQPQIAAAAARPQLSPAGVVAVQLLLHLGGVGAVTGCVVLVLAVPGSGGSGAEDNW